MVDSINCLECTGSPQERLQEMSGKAEESVGILGGQGGEANHLPIPGIPPECPAAMGHYAQ